MAAHFVQSRNGNARLSRYRPMSEINVTPMVDVMLVLLVIFMVAAPLLTVGVPVDLPQTEAPAINQPQEPLVITVNAAGKLFLQNAPIDDDQLVPRLEAITKSNPNADIYVRGDQAISYGRVMQVMGMISAAGFNKVSLITQPTQAPAPGQAKTGKQP
jgi:biopolymer transport protein TolR